MRLVDSIKGEKYQDDKRQGNIPTDSPGGINQVPLSSRIIGGRM